MFECYCKEFDCFINIDIDEDGMMVIIKDEVFEVYDIICSSFFLETNLFIRSLNRKYFLDTIISIDCLLINF